MLMLALMPSIDLGEVGSTTAAAINPLMVLVTPLVYVALAVLGGTLAVAVVIKLIFR